MSSLDVAEGTAAKRSAPTVVVAAAAMAAVFRNFLLCICSPEIQVFGVETVRRPNGFNPSLEELGW
jgi:hypothetical protein